MTRTLKGSLLIASMLVVTWATSSEACHRRRACASPSDATAIGVYLRGPHGLLRWPGAATAWLAGATTAAGMPAARPAIPAGTQPVRPARPGYDFGRPGYNPGGLGGPASGLGVRPGLGVGGFGPGR